MSNEILIVKRNKKKENRIKFNVKKRKANSEKEYSNVIDIKDYRQLAILFDDLRILFDAPIDKAFNEMRKKKSPFW